MLKNRGSRLGILIVGDSSPANLSTGKSIKYVLDPIHPVYNSLILPVKFYLNNYLNSVGYKLPLEGVGRDYFYYINAVQDPSKKSNPDLTELEKEVRRSEHKIILCMGNFAFWAVESVLGREVMKNLGIKELGQIFSDRMNDDNKRFPLNLPILHNIANLKFDQDANFILDINTKYISNHHYVGVKLAEFLHQNKSEFPFIFQI